jgi:hypothetical protein
MREIRRHDEVVDDDGFIVESAYSAWDCDCGEEVTRTRGQSDVLCHGCGQWFNASGQRLRNDWMRNRSNYDDDVDDMRGYEDSFYGED